MDNIITQDDAPPWISARWKREEWAQEQNSMNDPRALKYTCDKCGRQFVGIPDSMRRIFSGDSVFVGVIRSKTFRQSDCILCAACNAALVSALQEFEERWIA